MPDPLSPAPAAAREEAGVDAKPRLAPVQHLGREQRHGGTAPAPRPRTRVAAPRSSATLGARGRRLWPRSLQGRGCCAVLAAPCLRPGFAAEALGARRGGWGS